MNKMSGGLRTSLILLLSLITLFAMSTGNASAWIQGPPSARGLPGEVELTSGTFIIYLSKKTLKEDNNSATYRYSARLSDSSQAVLSGASISFEGYENVSKNNFMKKAVEKKAGFYEVEVVISKPSVWDITILGKYEPYPFRMSFQENLADKSQGKDTKIITGVPIKSAGVPDEASSSNSSAMKKQDTYALHRLLLYAGIGIFILGSLLKMIHRAGGER